MQIKEFRIRQISNCKVRPESQEIRGSCASKDTPESSQMLRDVERPIKLVFALQCRFDGRVCSFVP